MKFFVQQHVALELIVHGIVSYKPFFFPRLGIAAIVWNIKPRTISCFLVEQTTAPPKSCPLCSLSTTVVSRVAKVGFGVRMISNPFIY